MLTKDILIQLELGVGVAEQEKMLEAYFLKTDIFYSLINNKIDIISGSKGTGKSSIYKYIIENYRRIPELNEVEVIPAINPTGNPVFKIVTEKDNINENQFIALWKWYIFSLIGNSTVETYKQGKNENIKKLEYMLNLLQLRIIDHRPKNVFQHIVDWFRKLANPSSLETGLSIDPATGMPTISLKTGYQDEVVVETKSETVSPDEALDFLNQLLSNAGYSVWVLMDRLDEAFQGFSSVGYIAIRSLFRTYLDLLAFDHIKLKLFVRNDLFGKVIGKNFVNLTHINAMRRTIFWTEDDLVKLILERIRASEKFLQSFSGNTISDSEIFSILFPLQVDKGQKKPKTWTWIFTHIRDGNNVKAPRNLIDLVREAKAQQIHKDEREIRIYSNDTPLLESGSIRQAYKELSRKRVEDTLFDEGDEVAVLIERFRNSKAEHDGLSLSRIITKPLDESRDIIGFLVDIGFLEQVGTNYKVPLLYREGLNITRGKAF